MFNIMNSMKNLKQEECSLFYGKQKDNWMKQKQKN